MKTYIVQIKDFEICEFVRISPFFKTKEKANDFAKQYQAETKIVMLQS